MAEMSDKEFESIKAEVDSNVDQFIKNRVSLIKNTAVSFEDSQQLGEMLKLAYEYAVDGDNKPRSAMFKSIVVCDSPKECVEHMQADGEAVVDSVFFQSNAFGEHFRKAKYSQDLVKVVSYVESRVSTELAKYADIPERILRVLLGSDTGNIPYEFYYGNLFQASFMTTIELICASTGMFLKEAAVKLLLDINKLTKMCHMLYPTEEKVYVSRFPVKMNINAEGQLHKDGDAAVEYENGDAVYALGGVQVSKEIALTPAEQLDPTLVAKVDNVDMRKALVDKIGVERLCQKLNAQVVNREVIRMKKPVVSEDMRGDKWEHKEVDYEEVDVDYEIVNLDLGDRVRPYLKMLNPSIGGYHVEGVPPDCSRCIPERRDICPFRSQGKGCDTVRKALFFRNGTEELPEFLT